ncbi:hypothetical protein Taro_027958 [Colocasia esculenta]|uniref:Pentatricopeptide repeat-containing protein n=1 Tax=Colocasia esculenta TaxID=4460 RepID=A0A843VH64_COLES|nr:hypothetical protein [Colocasia esculenta]
MAMARPLRPFLSLTSPPPPPLPSPLPPLSSPFPPRDLSSCGGGDGEEGDPLVADVVSILTEQRSRSRWGFLKSLYGPSGLTPAQAALVTLSLRNNPRLALRFFRWSEAASLCRHDLSSYAAIVHVLARARLRSAAQSLIRSAILQASAEGGGGENAPVEVLAALDKSYRTFDSAPLVFDLLVRACLQAGRVEQAVELVRKLRRRGLSPAVGTCNEVIRAVSRGRGAEAGFEIYEELFVLSDGGIGVPSRGRTCPNVQTFNALLLSLHREGRLDDAERIRGEMEKFVCSPNCFTFSILMAGLCEEGKVREANSLWEEMAAKGIKPDATAYNTFLVGFCKIGEMDRAKELFREMALEGVEPTGTTYDRLICGYCCIRDVHNALLLFDEMRRKDFAPEVSTVDELIEELCRQRRIAEGLRVFRGEMGVVGFVPSKQMYVSLIRGFCRHGLVEEGLKLQKEMAGKGFEPDSEIYGAFFQVYTEKGDVERAGRLKDEMLKLGVQERLKPAASADEQSSH